MINSCNLLLTPGFEIFYSLIQRVNFESNTFDGSVRIVQFGITQLDYDQGEFSSSPENCTTTSQTETIFGSLSNTCLFSAQMTGRYQRITDVTETLCRKVTALGFNSDFGGYEFVELKKTTVSSVSQYSCRI